MTSDYCMHQFVICHSDCLRWHTAPHKYSRNVRRWGSDRNFTAWLSTGTVTCFKVTSIFNCNLCLIFHRKMQNCSTAMSSRSLSSLPAAKRHVAPVATLTGRSVTRWLWVRAYWGDFCATTIDRLPHTVYWLYTLMTVPKKGIISPCSFACKTIACQVSLKVLI